MPVVEHVHFVYYQSVNVADETDAAVSRIAAAIGEPARARMLYYLADGRARTGTELAVVAEVTPSTASVHLQRLRAQGLVKVSAQGKHRYYSLEGTNVAAALEALSVLAGRSPQCVCTAHAKPAACGTDLLRSHRGFLRGLATRPLPDTRDGCCADDRRPTMHATSP